MEQQVVTQFAEMKKPGATGTLACANGKGSLAAGDGLRFLCASLGNWEARARQYLFWITLAWITLADSVKEIGKGWGAGGVERGFSW